MIRERLLKIIGVATAGSLMSADRKQFQEIANEAYAALREVDDIRISTQPGRDDKPTDGLPTDLRT